MARSLTAGLETATLSSHVAPIIMVEMLFSSGPVRIWTGLGNLTWNAVVWTGAGTLLGIGNVQETKEIRASGLDISLSGVPAEVLSLALAEQYQGRTARIYIGALDTNTGTLLGEPYALFIGRMDVMQISETTEPVITVATESRLIDLERPRERRYDHNDQQIEYAGDKFFEFVQTIQNQEVTWGQS